MADNTQTKTRLVKIGSAQGVRIPKTLLEQAGLTGDAVELETQHGQIIVRRARAARQGWEAQFAAMTNDETLKDDEPLTLTTWENSEWEWE